MNVQRMRKGKVRVPRRCEGNRRMPYVGVVKIKESGGGVWLESEGGFGGKTQTLWWWHLILLGW